ncbi:L-lactate permease [Paraglaciecola sp.]|uniref:L-lactate permease n=1 Tax=Paraglaciecola sp. TaxID=1920173 RepID=UPI0030F3A662
MLLLGAAYLPIILLIYLMSKKDSLPASQALPLCAVVAYLVVLVVFDREVDLVHASILSGMLMAWTPILIIAGAIFLFQCMEVAGALDIMRHWLNHISSNPIAQLMIVAWAFSFLIEGASGFGTPAAIAAPILVSLGFPPLRAAICCLILNSIPVTFGAVGSPIWFGLSMVDLNPLQLTDVAWKSALINSVAAPFVVIAALAFVVEHKKQLWQNLGFIILSTLSCTVPYLILSGVSVEFPSLIGGLIGLVLTLILAKFGIGLRQERLPIHSSAAISPMLLLKASFPLWGTVLLLVLTRIPEIGLKALLQLTEPAWQFNLGYLGSFSISASLVLSLEHIFNTPVSWRHSLLYVPSIVPFLVIGVATLKWFKQGSLSAVVSHTSNSMQKPLIALMGALVFVNMMMLGGEQSAVTQIGQHLALISGNNWGFFAPFLGALGSFFSGSATISNLTFAGIQQSIASDLELNLSTVLAMQSVGAAMGNMTCINNIVAVASVLALQNKEGYILKRTIIVMVLYGVIAGLMGLILD